MKVTIRMAKARGEFLGGKSYAEVASKYGVSKGTVRRWVDKVGDEMMMIEDAYKSIELQKEEADGAVESSMGRLRRQREIKSEALQMALNHLANEYAKLDSPFSNAA